MTEIYYNHGNLLKILLVERLNADFVFMYSNVVLPDGEPIHPRAEDIPFFIMCDFPDKYIKFPKWSCVLNCCS